MPEKIAERITQAVAKLEVAPTDHLLEIGCGYGHAVALICEQLTSGSITAIDRSEKMITAARKRNQACSQGQFHTASVTDAQFEPAQFNKIFAINVNVFWQKHTRELDLMRGWLQPVGAIYLFYETPTLGQMPIISTQVTQLLREKRFTVQDVTAYRLFLSIRATPKG